MKKRIVLSLTAITLLAALSMTLGGCSACSRGMSSSPPHVSSVAPVPESSSMPSHPESSLPHSESMPSSSGEASTLPALAMSADFLRIGALDGKAVTWGPGTQRDDHGRPTACLGLQKTYGSYNADFIAPDAPVVTLTFDQGYENGFTATILDTLHEKNVQGVFFLTGHYVRTQPALVQRMIDEGHILGNHTNNHLNFTKCSLEEAFEDAKWMQDALREQFGYELRLFRFPEGAFSERSLALVQQMGYRSVFWSFGYQDWDPNNQMAPADALKKVTGALHPGEVMLLHTVGKTNSLILGDLIDFIWEQGYTVGPYSAMCREASAETAASF
ncbi:MAG: polysaccharide deacetylase family protein [Oscillospiraceae bacterium]